MLNFDAVIFDMDGVVTQTALVHASAWERMFNEYLRYREREFSEPFRRFSHDEDYLQFVDGRPRYEGVTSFLKSRGIKIPLGEPEDQPRKETICGLGNRKNEIFNQMLEEEGVGVYDSTIIFVKELLRRGVRVGIATSSKNCSLILKRAGVANLFETSVDGVVAAELGLRGKPEPDIFILACNTLGVRYDRAVVVEDAVSGVRAGAKGKFGLIVGVARGNNAHELLSNGADLVVRDISELSINDIHNWFSQKRTHVSRTGR
jgi:beta-phosphoglucomutase family hydrolase